jgi:hypothetical protein
MITEKFGFKTRKEVRIKIRFLKKEYCKLTWFYLDFELLYMDDFIDSLLREERFCDVILPRLQVEM